MNFDKIIECSRCGGDLCYSQEINDEIKIDMCLSCGFQSNSIMKVGSKFLEEQMEVLPELYKSLIDEEEDTGKVWMPTNINIEDKGMIFANGSNRENWGWAAVKAIPVKDEEKEKYKGADWRTDISTLKMFPERDFLEALSFIGILPE